MPMSAIPAACRPRAVMAYPSSSLDLHDIAWASSVCQRAKQAGHAVRDIDHGPSIEIAFIARRPLAPGLATAVVSSDSVGTANLVTTRPAGHQRVLTNSCTSQSCMVQIAL
jgi:hypothetical protein